MRKTILLYLVVLLFLWTAQLDAAPTTVTQAENIVTGWLKVDMQPLGMALGQQVVNVETFSDANERPIYYAVYLEPSGFVIVPAAISFTWRPHALRPAGFSACPSRT